MPPPSLSSRIPIGWREWIALPGLGIEGIKAKIDTGARTSSLHVASMIPKGDPDTLEILLRPERHGAATRRQVHVIDRVLVRSSGGQEELRPVILATLLLGGRRLRARLTLTDRGEMLFPMLIGRTTLRDLFVVIPEACYLLERPRR